MDNNYTNGYVTCGSYFTYKGIRYGRYTQILFTEEFYKRANEYIDPCSTRSWAIMGGYKFPYFRVFHSVENKDGKEIWRLQRPKATDLKPTEYVDVDPERDIANIVKPVWYLEPKELVRMRLSNGTWMNYIGVQTLFFIICLLASLVTNQWYLVWTVGTYIYLRTSYITLSKGELNRGW